MSRGAVSPPSASEAVTPDPALVARFRGDVEHAAGRALRSDEPIALAVSGGPDSMAMLALAAAARPGQVIAATFDHGLRTGSADEAAMVAGACATLGVPHETLWPSEPIPDANLQAAARDARYAALRRWAAASGVPLLLTAHHADDQAETFLMRANRGSGLAGLAGIRARHDADAVATIRPLLGWRRAALGDLVTAAGLPFVDDPSNADPRFDRVAMRDFLNGQEMLDPAQIAASAAHLAEIEGDIRAMGTWLWDSRRSGSDAANVRLDMTDLPRELKRRLTRMAIQSVRDTGTFSDATNIEPLLDALNAGKSATQAGVMASAEGMIWHFRAAPPRRSH